MDALKEIEQTREEMKKLPKEMQALLIIQKYLEPNYNKDAWLILCHCITDYDKKSKALETIKEKEVNVEDFIYSCKCSKQELKEVHNVDTNYDLACDCVGCDKEELTKEEFDLLKEVLR